MQSYFLFKKRHYHPKQRSKYCQDIHIKFLWLKIWIFPKNCTKKLFRAVLCVRQVNNIPTRLKNSRIIKFKNNILLVQEQ